ncbi:nuclear transport factor 2 family protein [Nocardia ignorata]|uniref:SnoaL-like protein n=1 Tax=Nocardia ignorata TaxID=145285 RepID=A0A4R6PKA2_NOCIG|nr:nuclear transport factor 2 family protein [Nocardia ignorata]TDP38844.1 SnoaL-like protein [Nocardia ignorata]
MDLAQRIDTLEKIEAIKQLKHRYWRACDNKDPKTMRDCFIRSGADLDYGRIGTFHDAGPLVEIFTRIALHKVDGKHVVLDMHHGIHPDITLTGERTATGRWTLRFRQVNLIDNTEFVSTGDYDDDYVIEDDRWKISRSHFTERWSITRPLLADSVIAEGTFAEA